MTRPNHETDELIEVLAAGYAAPPLDAAFSDNLVRRMKAEVVPQTSLLQSPRLRRAVVLCVAGVAASIMVLINVSNPLGKKPLENEVAMQPQPGSSNESSRSLESESIRSLETELIPTNDAKTSDIKPLSQDARRTFSLETLAKNVSEAKNASEVPSDVLKEQVTKDGYRSLSTFESMSAAVMEEFEVVTQERAKALGLSLTSQANGPDAVRVSLEFEKQRELKEYRRTELRQFEGNKVLLLVALKEGESQPGRVVIDLVAARSNLATLSLDIVAQDARSGRVRYALPLKDFVTKPKGQAQP